CKGKKYNMSDFDRHVDLLSEKKRRLLALRMIKEQKASQQKPKILPRPPDMENIALSFAQQRLWFLDRLLDGKGVYNLPSVYRITGPLNVAMLHATLNTIVQRHEMLRTTFRMVNHEPIQHLHPELKLPLPLINMEEVQVEEQ